VSIDSKNYTMIKVEFKAQTSKNKAIARESCSTCNFVLGVQAATGKLHCGLAYYQVSAIEHRPAKIDNYPVVATYHTCFHWSRKVIT
jgi:hypothetical protein